MAEVIIQKEMMDKLTILSDAAKFDVACTSSGVERKGNGRDMGNTFGTGICHAFTSDGRCISLLKILFTNECIYDCKYCINRSSNDVLRTSFTPEEVCRLTMEFYRRNYIEGLFVSEAVQSKGIGKQLLNYAKDIKFSLRLSVYQKNTRAIAFYQREQFVICSERINESTNEKEFVMTWSKQRNSGMSGGTVPCYDMMG